VEELFKNKMTADGQPVFRRDQKKRQGMATALRKVCAPTHTHTHTYTHTPHIHTYIYDICSYCACNIRTRHTAASLLAIFLASSRSVFNDIKPRWTASLDQHGHVKHEDADGACACACVLGFVLALVVCTSNR
jgi:hypothetical protein